MKRLTYKQIQRQLLESEANQPYTLRRAHESVDKTSIDRLTGSGIVLHITGLGGADIVEPVMIGDGLSNETIAAIKADLKRCSDLKTSLFAIK